MMQSKCCKRIAITGGIGSGKSAVLEILRKKGYPAFSCDEIYAELCGEQEYLDQLSFLFPDCVKEGAFDRRTLSKKVFSDEKARGKLNALSHPLIMKRLLDRMAESPLAFAEVPLLFESRSEMLFDGVIVVMREKSARIEGVKKRSGLSEKEILMRMARQFDYKNVPENCFIIKNDGTLSALEAKIEEIVSKIV